MDRETVCVNRLGCLDRFNGYKGGGCRLKAKGSSNREQCGAELHLPSSLPPLPFQPVSALRLGDILVGIRREGGRERRAAIDPLSVQGVLWPNATVPYVFSSNIRELPQHVCMRALLTYQQSGLFFYLA